MPEFRRTGAEYFRIGFELRVDFEADDGLPTFLHWRSPYLMVRAKAQF
jgi:hypothetical protein